MRILFICRSMYSWGGIQTWLTRMAPRLRASGHDVGLLTRPMGKRGDVTSEIVDQLSEDASIHYAAHHWFKAPRSLQPPLGTFDVLFACNLEALLLAAQVQQRSLPKARIIAGVFGPREYCWKTSRLQRRWSQHLAEAIVRQLPVENFMFSTDGMARQTGECLGRDLSRAPVLPIPIDTDRFRPRPNRPVNRSKIVSVARLARNYTHHGQMIRVIRDLRDQGHTYTYHAYGEGEMRATLEAEARRLAVDDAVFFHGAVPYERFGEVISDAFAYIATGTALIEAAACGLPSLVGIDSHPEPATYGFIQDTLANEIGGYVPGHPEYSIGERVLWLASRSEQEYREIEKSSRTRVEEFSLTRLLPRFVDILHGAAPFSLRVSNSDRTLGVLDWLVYAVMRRLGAPDILVGRHVRPVSPQDADSPVRHPRKEAA